MTHSDEIFQDEKEFKNTLFDIRPADTLFVAANFFQALLDIRQQPDEIRQERVREGLAGQPLAGQRPAHPFQLGDGSEREGQEGRSHAARGTDAQFRH